MARNAEQQANAESNVDHIQARRAGRLRRRLLSLGFGLMAAGIIVGLAAIPVIGVSITAAAWMLWSSGAAVTSAIPITLAGAVTPRGV